MLYDGRIFRPPSEGNSLILQVSVGCLHNACTFCSMYKEKRFRIKTPEEIMQAISLAKQQMPGAQRVFLADGDALALDTPLLVEILDTLYEQFPNLQRVGVYGGPLDILKKSSGELNLLHSRGLGIVYMGIESGSAAILRQVNKGVSPQELVRAGSRIREAGLKLSATVIIGLGGKEHSVVHAVETASVVNQINPDYLGALTLMLEPAAPLSRQVELGKFSLLEPMEALAETRLLLENLLLVNCIFRSNHASNYLALKGTLPTDKAKLLAEIDCILAGDRQDYLKPETWRGL